MCRFRSKVSLNPLPQNVQRYRLVSLWHFMCLFNRRCSPNPLPQMRQANLPWSDSERTDGMLLSPGLLSAGSTAMGFLIPWPPLIISRGASGGIPY